MKKIKKPKIGDKIYVYTSDYMNGGIATIERVFYLGEGEHRRIWVKLLEGIAEYRYDYLFNQQAMLKKRFGKTKARSLDMEKLEEQVRRYGGKVIW